MLNLVKRQFETPIMNRFCKTIFSITLLLSFLLVSHIFIESSRLMNEENQSTINHIKKNLEETLSIYSNIIGHINKNILDKNLTQKSNDLSKLFKQFYLRGKEGKDRIGFIDMIFYDDINHRSISKFSINNNTKTIVPTLEHKLRKEPGKIFIVSNSNNTQKYAIHELYLVVGIANDSGKYIGSLSILLDTETWINYISKKNKNKNALLLLNEKHEIILVGANTYQGFRINEKINLEDNLLNFKYKNFKFSSIHIPTSSYLILVGYNYKNLYMSVIKDSFVPLLITWIIAFLVLSLILVLHVKLRKEISSEYSNKINFFEEDIAKLIKELELYKTTNESYKDLIEAINLSDNAYKNLVHNINANIAHTLTEIREIVRLLVQSHDGIIDIPINDEKRAALLSSIHNKLTYLSEFCVSYEEEEIDVTSLLYLVLNIFKKNIFHINLNIKTNIASNLGTIHFHKLLLQQIIASILYLSFDTARPKGVISIDISKKKDMLNIKIQDDGFYLSKNFQDSTADIVHKKICPIQLDIAVIKKIIEFHGGNLQTENNKDGKTLIVNLPFKKPAKNKKDDNIVFLKIV